MKFLVADDHPLVRRALALTLERIAPDATVLEAEALSTALDLMMEHPDIDLFLMDLFMPGSDGVDGVRHARQIAGPIPVAVISAAEETDLALGALAAGAAGYLPKSLPEDVMRAAVSLMLAGGVYVPLLVAKGAIQAATPQQLASVSTVDSSITAGSVSLTPRQRQVLDQVIEGLSNKEIAERLGLAEATVKVHITAILRAYGVNSRAKAIGAARRERDLMAT